MMKRTWKNTTGLTLVAVFILLLAPGMLSAHADKGVLFVAPANHFVLQIMHGVLSRYSGHYLVSYQPGTAPDEPVIYAWDGKEWNYVSLARYREGRFIPEVPSRALILGPEDMLPDRLVEATEWVPVVLNSPDLDTASILNAVGQLLDFQSADWRWCARRYRLDLKDLNAPLRGESWYDQPHKPRRFRLPKVPVPPSRRDDESAQTACPEPPVEPALSTTRKKPSPVEDPELSSPSSREGSAPEELVLPVPEPAAPESAASGRETAPPPTLPMSKSESTTPEKSGIK